MAQHIAAVGGVEGSETGAPPTAAGKQQGGVDTGGHHGGQLLIGSHPDALEGVGPHQGLLVKITIGYLAALHLLQVDSSGVFIRATAQQLWIGFGKRHQAGSALIRLRVRNSRRRVSAGSITSSNSKLRAIPRAVPRAVSRATASLALMLSPPPLSLPAP